MAFLSSSRLTAIAFLLIAWVPSSFGQGDPTASAAGILSRVEDDQRRFIAGALELGIPPSYADELIMLVINRSALTIPLLEERIELLLQADPAPQHLIDLISEMIAYAGDEHSLKAIARLIALDEQRFAPLVGRSLTHSSNWRNPFGVAYRGLELGSDPVARYTAAWVATVLRFDRMKRAWAQAMIDRYGRAPREDDWDRDPIALRLADGAARQLRQSIIQLAAEEERNRRRR
jgi:hypothetical protein